MFVVVGNDDIHVQATFKTDAQIFPNASGTDVVRALTDGVVYQLITSTGLGLDFQSAHQRAWLRHIVHDGFFCALIGLDDDFVGFFHG